MDNGILKATCRSLGEGHRKFSCLCFHMNKDTFIVFDCCHIRYNEAVNVSSVKLANEIARQQNILPNEPHS